ncbi:MAG: HlyD family efflux transporter periplasmic adaptor subunit [Planctomycetota bacterium]
MRIFLGYVLPPVLIVASVVAFYALGSKPETHKKKKPPQRETLVEVVKARVSNGAFHVEASGVAVPFREITLSNEIGGRISYKNPILRSGHEVTEGEELIRLDNRDFQLAVERLQQKISQTDSALRAVDVEQENTSRLIEIAKKALELQQRELDRLSELSDDNAISVSEVDAAQQRQLLGLQQLTTNENQQRQLESRKDTLEHDKALFEIELKQAKLNLERTVIRAPISGTVVRSDIEEDAFIQPGTNLATIEDTSAIEVLCHLESQDLDLIRDSQPQLKSAEDLKQDRAQAKEREKLPNVPVEILLNRAGNEYVWEAVLDRRDGVGVDQRTRTLPCRILVSNPQDGSKRDASAREKSLQLIRGMFVQVRIQLNIDRPLISIPESAVRPGKQVWVKEDGKLRMIPIRIVKIMDGQVFVDASTGAMGPGVEIILSPVPQAKDGLAVSAGNRKGGGKGGGKGGAKVDGKATGKGGGPGTQAGKSNRTVDASGKPGAEAKPASKQLQAGGK